MRIELEECDRATIKIAIYLLKNDLDTLKSDDPETIDYLCEKYNTFIYVLNNINKLTDNEEITIRFKG